VDKESQPHEPTAEDRPETFGDRLLKRLGLDPNKWTVGDRRLALFGVGIGLVIMIIAVCGYVFGWEWTGLAKRTFWDWLSLLVVPLVLALGGYFFTRSENQRTREAADEQRALDRQIADEQRSLDREIAHERRQDDALQAYLDGMSQLLTNKERPLHRAQPGDSLSTLARARTLTVLPRLDGERKARVVQFLYESGLIAKRRPVLNLHGADVTEAALILAELRRANLRGANLRGANLSSAILNEAILEEAILEEANLLYTKLRSANLNRANLSDADLRSDLRDADLRGADLRGADLHGAELHGANLIGAELHGAGLIGADLIGADLRGANLIGADLREANLSGANLEVANLDEANLGPDLSSANPEEIHRSGATGITNEQLEQQAWSLKGATMPDGQKYEDWIKDKEVREENE
jgi:uncharacterized protein YjbI with pentapeptide repeats